MLFRNNAQKPEIIADIRLLIAGIENIEFICGRAETVLPDVIRTLDDDEELVAIVDPPRAGLSE